MAKDYYQTLGTSRGAAADELKKAYRKLAMQYHPDRNPGDQEAEKKFKEVNEAYNVLKDQSKRQAYDQMGHEHYQSHAAAGGGASRGTAHSGFDAHFGGGRGGFQDIFEEMFEEFTGGGRSSGGAHAHQRGQDLQYHMKISLEDAYRGVEKKIRLTTWDACRSCKGSGAEKGTSSKSCHTCHGRGKVRSQQGFFTVERTCPSCQGLGQVIEKPCHACHGAGREQKEKTLNVIIPAGVENGTRIRLAGEGEAGLRGGPAGDLYVFLEILPHKLFQREGANIHCKVPLSMVTAAIGGKIDVPTIEGKRVELAIPAGTQTNKQFRLRGKGMSILRRSSQGDMYVHVVVETPVNLTKKQKELLKEFGATDKKHKTSPESEGFFSRVKDFWDDFKD